MSKLRYVDDAVWAALPLTDFRPRFFVECYVEKLRMQTPHFYQSRLLNIFSASEELIECINVFQENDKNGAYVLSSMDELVDCWDADSIAQELFGSYASLRAELTKHAKSGDLDKHTQIRIRGLCRAISGRLNEYGNLLFTQLEEVILGQVDLNQVDRITANIDRLTGLLITYLLNQGYSPTYLYNRTEMFVRLNNYGGRVFADQFRLIISRLRSNQGQFEIYFGLRVSRRADVLAIVDEQNLEFLPVAPPEIVGKNLLRLRKNIRINVVAKATILSTDYVTAALRTKERLDRFLDAETALEFGEKIKVSENCVSILRGALTRVDALNVEMLLAFMSSENGTAFSHSGVSVRKIFGSLDAPAKEQLGRSLRHLRLAKHSVSFEQKLLNLWIALETLFSNSGSTILGNMLEYIPDFYAMSGLTRRVIYLKDLLIENEIPTTPIISANICVGLAKFDASVTDGQIFALLRNEAAAIELFNSLGHRGHLKFKLMRIFSELKDNKALSARLTRTRGDVARPLRRIYFLRNKIAHTGHFHGVRPQLITHLLDYVATTYRAISGAANAAREGETYSILELLGAARMGVDLVTARVSTKDEVVAIDQVTLHAVI